MFGPQGALPLTTTEEAYHWLRERDDAFARFVDIFKRRFLELFFRAWADARPIAQHDRPDDDRFRDLYRLDDRDRHARFRDADYLRLREAAVCRVARCAGQERLAPARALVEPAEVPCRDRRVRRRLGSRSIRASAPVWASANSRLGDDCVSGASMFSVSDKFRVRIYVRNIEHFMRFLPARRSLREIADAVFLNVGEEFDWDMELAIPAGEITPGPPRQVRPARLDELDGAELGKTDETIRRDARFHPAERMRTSGGRQGRAVGRGKPWPISALRRSPANSTASATKLSSGPAPSQRRRQPQCRARPLALPSSCRRSAPTSRLPPIISSSIAAS